MWAAIAPFLMAIAWPLAKKIFLALGIGWLTYQGLGLIATQVSNEVVNLWGQMPSSIMQIGSLLGVPQSIGIMLGALSAKAAYAVAGRLAKIAT